MKTPTLFKKSLFTTVALTLLMLVTAFAVYAAPTAVTVEENAGEPAPLFEETEMELCGEFDASLSSAMTVANDDADTASLFGETLEDVLREGFKSYAREIDIRSFGIKRKEIQEVGNLYGDVLRMDLGLYYVDFTFTYSYNFKDVITKIKPQYNTKNDAEIKATQALIEEKINEIVSLTYEYENPVEKLIVLYNEACLRCTYDYSLNNRSGKALLIDGTTVCNGYASAMHVLAERAGIRGKFVISDEEYLNHIWNAFYIDGEWYHVDATWGDPSNGKDHLYMMYATFLKTDSWMIENYGYYGFEKIGNDNATKYNEYFWNDITMPLSPYDGKLYFTETSDLKMTVFAFDLENETVYAVYETYAKWPSSTSENGHIRGVLSGTAYHDNRVYFNFADKIVSMDVESFDLRTEYVLESSATNSIYGVCRIGNQLKYIVGPRGLPKSITPFFMNFPERKVVIETGSDISLRINGDSGIRFTATVNRSSNPSAFGWIYTRESLLDEAGIKNDEFTMESDVRMVKGYNFTDGIENSVSLESDDETACFAMVVTFIEREEDGLPAAYKLCEKFVVRPFAVIDGETVYGKATQAVSVYDASLLYLNNEELFEALGEEQQAYILDVIEKVETSRNV